VGTIPRIATSISPQLPGVLNSIGESDNQVVLDNRLYTDFDGQDGQRSQAGAHGLHQRPLVQTMHVLGGTVPNGSLNHVERFPRSIGPEHFVRAKLALVFQ
jgi:hypothetical protein